LPALSRGGHEVALLYIFDAPEGGLRIDEGLILPHWRAEGSVPDDVFRWRPDVCYLQTTDSADVDEELARRLPTVLYAHSFYGTCATGLKCRGRASPTPCNVRFGAACLARNYTQSCGVTNPVRLWETFRKQVRRSRLLPIVRYVLAASRYMADEMIAHGAPADRTVVVPLFPTDVTPDPQPPSMRPRQGKVLFLGRFTRIKGGLLLIEAARLLSNDKPIELTFAGAGPDEAEWRAAAERAGVRATFQPWMEREQLTALRRDADLLAVPSVWPEPFGLVGIEAACQGLPSIALDVGGIRDWLIPGETGELALSPPTAQGLADAIRRALGDPEYHLRLRVGAWRRSNRFSLERHLHELEPILARVARGDSRPPLETVAYPCRRPPSSRPSSLKGTP